MSRRWDRWLTRLEKSVRWLKQVREEKRAGRPGERKWQALIDEMRKRAEAQARAAPPARPLKAAAVAVAATLALPAMAAASAQIPENIPPPVPRQRPAVEFIERASGMSIAINTATGQMASSADVLMALGNPEGRDRSPED